MSDLPTYVLERDFDASREALWRAWTDPQLLARWYGPGAETVVHGLDLKPGGLWRLEMRWGETSHRQRIEYVEVSAPARLVWLHANADADWNIIPSPMMADWPRVLLTTVTFEAAGDRTRLRLTWVPHEATDAEVAAFASALEGVGRGWEAGMDLLAQILAQARTPA
ncbi:MAG: SRPBCC domain-containing protein [Phenylobacterium sp.]|uniref:SRPBCC family protein n=1 Tax=Phenylobacterium sp. TaxID=1871053 RepID=UPI002734CAF2|nr:SRPBCC domain-containing protein [Phenylobacterium sp.]MDP3749937.1 SRPBCC domain-containing protein [Phenylobacterium sp.]